MLEEGAGLVVDGGAQGCVWEEGVEEEFGEEGGAVDEGETEKEGGKPGGRIEY